MTKIKAEPTACSFEAYGVSMCVRANNTELLSRIRSEISSIFAHSRFISSNKTADHEIDIRVGSKWCSYYHNGELKGSRLTEDSLLEGLASLLRLTVAEYAPDHVFVHSGVVEWKGKALLLPGRSYSGKTTLTAELAKLGARYYSDEYAVIAQDGLVHPFPKPLSLRHGSNDGKQTDTPVESVGGVAGTKPVGIGLVLITSYKEHARWNPKRLTAGQGIMEVIKNTVPARRNPRLVLPVLSLATRNAVFLKTNRREAAVTAPEILKICESL